MGEEESVIRAKSGMQRRRHAIHRARFDLGSEIRRRFFICTLTECARRKGERDIYRIRMNA